MPVKYVPFFPDTVEGQAILNNFTRSRRMLKYRDNDKVYETLRRGMPYYEVETIERVGHSEENEASKNLLIRGECISACAYLKERGIKVDLVYIDPPFASGADYAKTVYIRRNPKVVEAMEKAEEAMEIEEIKSFEEKMYGDIWNKEDYLNWMYDNLIAIKNVMNESAMIWVHIDWHIGHYIKILMDEIFSEDNYRNEIIVKRVKKSIREREYVRALNVATDSIFLYAKDDSVAFLPPTRPMKKEERWHAFDAPELRTGMDYELFGKRPPPNRHWMREFDKAEEWIDQGRLRPNENTGNPEYLIDASEEMLCDSLWDDITAYSFASDYDTEKNETLLKRILSTVNSNGLLVADFFGGSGVTAKVANDLKRNFIHVDVGINSIQTTRDRLVASGAEFDILDIKDGVNLFRNPTQTMEKLATLLPGLHLNTAGLSDFWFGTMQDSSLGTVPVYVPNLLDHKQKVLDIPIINQIINQELPELDNIKKVIVYYVDMDDEKEIKEFIKEENPTEIEVELRDLKRVLDETVIDDIVEYKMRKGKAGYEIEIIKFVSDRLRQKIKEYNQKRSLQRNGKTLFVNSEENGNGNDNGNGNNNGNSNGESDQHQEQRPFKAIEISDDGLELIELISLDCTNGEGVWKSDKEIKIDKLGYVIEDGKKTKTLWDGKIRSEKKPLRIKVRNIAGDESVVLLMG